MNIFCNSLPEAPPSDIIQWAEENVKVDGHSFDASRTPQLIEPLLFIPNAEHRTGTLVKPVQSGGSTVGEIAMAYWLRYWVGKLQFNWQHDGKAAERWKDRILPVLEKMRGLKWAGGFDKLICEARFVNSTLIVQGVVSKGALDSETIPLQINEEIHLWEPGMLDKARRRQTLVWNSKALDISNAGFSGDQLEAAYEEGTMEYWHTYCPGCRQHHAMRFQWDERHPELGGLRFDTSAGRNSNGKYSLSKVIPTIRYQMPCGFIIRDVPSERKQPGKYIRLNNDSTVYKRSWSYDAVSVAEIKWPELVSEWLKAVKARKAGDLEPMKRFKQERECVFWSDELIPVSSEIVLTQAIKLDRKGLPNRACRLAAADWQQGFKSLGQLTHYWLVIEDIMANCNSQVIFEGMVATDSELVSVLDEFEVPHSSCFIDASKNTKSILSFCYREGINAVSGIESHKGSFVHSDKVRRFYSEEKPIHAQLNMPPKYDYVPGKDGMIPSTNEPIVISYNKAGLLANHFFIREMKARTISNISTATPEDYIERIIPGDVSEQFSRHYEAWERVKNKQSKTNDEVEGFRKIRREDHMMMCLAYIDMLKDWSGLLGDRLAELGINKN